MVSRERRGSSLMIFDLNPRSALAIILSNFDIFAGPAPLFKAACRVSVQSKVKLSTSLKG